MISLKILHAILKKGIASSLMIRASYQRDYMVQNRIRERKLNYYYFTNKKAIPGKCLSNRLKGAYRYNDYFWRWHADSNMHGAKGTRRTNCSLGIYGDFI